jgi:outer membrane autotransporter protein
MQVRRSNASALRRALMAGPMAALSVNSAWAACSTDTPTAGVTVTCTGTDTTGVSAASGQNNVTVNVLANARVSGSGAAIYLQQNSSVVNSGTLFSTGSSVSGAIIAGANSTITNNGIIDGSATFGGNGVLLGAGSTITNNGTIVRDAYGTNIGVRSGSVVTNTGLITSSGAAHLENPEQSGVLGVGVSGVTVTNSGTISQAANRNEYVSGQGGVLISGNNNTLINTGTIVGALAVALDAGSGNLLINFGTISAAFTRFVGTAVNLTGGNSTLMLGTTSTILGLVLADHVSTLDLAGTGSGTFNVGNIGPSAQYQGFSLFAKDGTSTWTLTGTDSNATPLSWSVNSGALVVTTDSLKGNAAVAAGAALVFDQTSVGVYAGSLSGSGSLTIQGTGGVIMNGANSFTGSTTIAGGTLQVGDASHPGASLGGSVSVLAGGALSGHGSIGGLVTNNGIVAPGGTIGTLTVGGSYAQSASGTLSIELAPSAGSQLAVGGAASLAGTLALSVDSFLVAGTKYVILTAGGGVSGTFGQLAPQNIIAYSLTPTYLPGEVDLTVNSAFGTVAQSTNQRAIAAAIDRSTSSALFGEIGTAFGPLSTVAQAQAVLDQVGGSAEGYAGLASAALRTGRTISSVIGQQLYSSAGADGPAALAQAPAAQRVQLASLEPHRALAQAPSGDASAIAWSAWTSGFGVFGGVAGNGNAHALDYSTGGALFGADARITPDLLIGGFTGYAGTGSSISGLPTSGTINSYTVGLYGSWMRDRFYVDGMLGYAYNDTRLTRTIGASGFSTIDAVGTTQSNQFLSSIETGRRYDLPEGVSATPFVGLQATTLSQGGLTETGAGAFDLAVGGQSTSSVRSSLGGRFDRAIELDDALIFDAGLTLGWAHEFADTSRSVNASFAGVPGSSFVLQAAAPRRDSALVGVGVATKLAPQASLYLRYDGDIDGHDDTHAVIGGLRLTW